MRPRQAPAGQFGLMIWARAGRPAGRNCQRHKSLTRDTQESVLSPRVAPGGAIKRGLLIANALAESGPPNRLARRRVSRAARKPVWLFDLCAASGARLVALASCARGASVPHHACRLARPQQLGRAGGRAGGLAPPNGGDTGPGALFELVGRFAYAPLGGRNAIIALAGRPPCACLFISLA